PCPCRGRRVVGFRSPARGPGGSGCRGTHPSRRPVPHLRGSGPTRRRAGSRCSGWGCLTTRSFLAPHQIAGRLPRLLALRVVLAGVNEEELPAGRRVLEGREDLLERDQGVLVVERSIR